MFSTLISIFLIISTLLGGSGITVAAAQSSQPGDLLYPLKILSEDVYYQLTSGDQTHLNLMLDYTERRMAEIEQLLQNGQLPGDEVLLRLLMHIQTALELAARQTPEEASQLLEQIRTRLEEQLRVRLQTNTDSNPAGDALQLRIRDMIQERIGWIDSSVQQLQQQLQVKNQQQQQTQQQNPNGAGQNSTAEPDRGKGGWDPQWMTVTPSGIHQFPQGTPGGNQGGSGSGQGR